MTLRKEYRWVIFKGLLDAMFKYFCVVVMVLILIDWGYMWFAGNEWTLNSQALVRILVISFFGVVPSFIIEIFVAAQDAKAKRNKNIMRFGLTSLFVLGAYVLTATAQNGVTINTLINFLLVYGGIMLYSSFNATYIPLKERKLAEQINERLNEFHNSENETYHG